MKNGEVSKIKEKNQYKEINNNKHLSNNKDNDEKLDDIQFLENIVEDSFSRYWLDNTFCLFKSINNIIYIIYANENKSIILYHLIKNKKINEIKNAHNEYITNFRYYFDKICIRDLIISISCDDNNIKLWNIQNLELLADIKNINKDGYLYSAYFLTDKNQNYFITSNCNFEEKPCELIKIFDFNGNKIKEIENSNDRTYIIDSYYEKKKDKNYIIAGYCGYVKSYDYSKNKVYHKYDENDNKFHNSIIINSREDIVKLIESSCSGNIVIWNFHSGELLKRIRVSDEWIYGICMWNIHFLFVGCKDGIIKLIELNKGKIVKDLIDHNNKVLTIKKINLPKYGQCLISQNCSNSYLKLWGIKK